jgi:hypothetical protein
LNNLKNEPLTLFMPVSDKENNAEFLIGAKLATKGRYLPAR